MSGPERICGYIVQSFHEDSNLPLTGPKRLIQNFETAFEAARDMAREYIMNRQEEIEGPFEMFSPTEEEIEVKGSCLIFRSRDIWIWLDAILYPAD